jgi:MSHA pilin protein MshA
VQRGRIGINFLQSDKVDIMKQVQRGFTLIELVMVIVILGVLAAVALPKFVDLKGDAQNAAAAGVAGALASASAINYAGCQIAGTPTAGKCVTVAACADVGALLNPPLTGYTFSGAVTTANGCVVTNSSVASASATFTALKYP